MNKKYFVLALCAAFSLAWVAMLVLALINEASRWASLGWARAIGVVFCAFLVLGVCFAYGWLFNKVFDDDS